MAGAFWFACLLNFKHIFAYVAPAYFVYLLKHYCFKNRHTKGQDNAIRTPSFVNFDVVKFVKLGALVIIVFLVSFGPFLYLVRLSILS